MQEIDKGQDLNKLVGINAVAVALNNENGKKTTTKTTKDPWIPDEAKREYHIQRLTQSKWSFWLSIIGSIVGFFILIWSIWYGVVNNDHEWGGVVSGIIIEAVSVLFYTLSNNANDKISEFFKELTIDSNVKEALCLTQKIKDDAIRDELMVKLSLHLSGIDEERICKYTKDICDDKE